MPKTPTPTFEEIQTDNLPESKPIEELTDEELHEINLEYLAPEELAVWEAKWNVEAAAKAAKS